MAAFNKFASFTEHLAEKIHNLAADTLKIYLTNATPVGTNTVKADIAEITAQNGYPAGGPTVTITASALSSGTYRLIGNDVVITAAGGSVGPFRHAILYNDTPASAPVDPLVGWWDYGSSITLLDGETFTIDLDQVNGILSMV